MVRSLSFLVLLALCFVGSIYAQNENGWCEYCTGKECGPNGIGGSCGTCPIGQSCHRGACICDRSCDGLECGADNCGTLCGECLAGQVCQNGICTGDCTPQCTRPDGTLRTCGWDRCDRLGRCGTCPDDCGFRCRDGTCECVPNCDGKHCGPDGCGGTCGVCEGGAICQGDNDPFPGTCYFVCEFNVRVEVREVQTDNLVIGQCAVSITGPEGFSAPNEVYPGNPPGFFGLTGTTGEYRFTTTCPGYQISVESHTVQSEGQLITLYVDWNTVLIEVRDEITEQLLPTASIQISGAGYSLSVNWQSPSYTWAHGGFMMYSFATSSTGYQSRTVQSSVTAETTLIVLYLGYAGIPIRVVECVSQDPVSTATITVSGATINYNGGASFSPPNGFTTYSFTTASTGYQSNTQSVNVQSTTNEIVLCLNYNPIPVRVTDCQTGELINGASVSVTSSSYTSYSASFTHSSSGTTWLPVGYMGQYTFTATAASYDEGGVTLAVSPSTSEIAICLNIVAYCGDGVCSNGENATPFQGECRDCGRLRGVISLAVGQKDQLVNITVDVWAHPTNPALFLRRGEPVPAPDFSTISDSKGYFAVSALSFDAQRDVPAGSASRRFYFRLSGRFTDRTSGNDVVTTLLPLWWNYELFNTQWTGSGSLVGTNNSPSLYFYMTPPFSTNDALVRIILSWGTLISTPSASLPDLDVVIAGPVNQGSIDTYGSGIVNFQNKDIHAQIEGLPYAKIITDQAQGYGPEVFDFYGVPGSATPLDVGFSDAYAPNAPANAYEIWIDRPNSSPNLESARTFLYDTNSFIVIYQNNGQVNEQILFDARTGVEYAYGFYNNDQWNQIPEDATMWHIIDLSETENGVVFDGFPGQDGADRSEQPGCKYSYAGGIFDPTKVMPCGHVAARGVPSELVYCPFTLEYPQTKRQEN